MRENELRQAIAKQDGRILRLLSQPLHLGSTKFLLHGDERTPHFSGARRVPSPRGPPATTCVVCREISYKLVKDFQPNPLTILGRGIGQIERPIAPFASVYFGRASVRMYSTNSASVGTCAMP